MRKLLTAFFALILMHVSQTTFAQERTITGTVLESDGTPVLGASVLIKGSGSGTQTDSHGHYSIKGKNGDVLEISAIGFTSREVKVRSSAPGTITLEKSNDQLQEVVVTALGIKKEQKSLGYSVTQLDAKELMKNKNTNVINSLAGKVPGVNITQYSGSPGAGASITLRGGTSTSETRQNQPLFVVDGIIYDNSTTVTGNTGTDGLSRSNTTYSDRVMDINPEDIESLSVLKGAAAAALYGSRAADGVVLITTKKGVEGRVTVDFNSKISTSWADK